MFEIKVTVEAPNLTAALVQLSESLKASVPVNTLISKESETAAAPVQEAAPVAVPVPEATTPEPPKMIAPDDEPDLAPAATPLTQEALSKAGAELVNAGKMDAIMELLKSFGVEALTQLSPDQYPAFAAGMRNLGASI